MKNNLKTKYIRVDVTGISGNHRVIFVAVPEKSCLDQSDIIDNYLVDNGIKYKSWSIVRDSRVKK